MKKIRLVYAESSAQGQRHTSEALMTGGVSLPVFVIISTLLSIIHQLPLHGWEMRTYGWWLEMPFTLLTVSPIYDG